MSDEAGIIPPFIDDLFLVFRTYSRLGLHDDRKIFAIPCGFACGYGGLFGKTDWLYEDMEKPKKNLIEREYDIFYSGQYSNNRIECINAINKIRNNYKCKINITNGFAKGYELDEYYKLMQNSKISIVPNGAVIPESFRYFEAFESNCIVISSFPVNNKIYKNWFYDNSPAIFINDWSELNSSLIDSLLTKYNLEKYNTLNKEYFDSCLSTKAVSEYIYNVIKNKE